MWWVISCTRAKKQLKRKNMKIKSLQIGKNNEAKTNVTYRKLGKHSYIVNEAILIIFIKGKEDVYTPILYKLSPLSKEDFSLDFLNNLKSALEIHHTASIENPEP